MGEIETQTIQYNTKQNPFIAIGYILVATDI